MTVIKPFVDLLLQQVREKTLARELHPEHGELYLVFPGMGPARYISEGGKVYIEGDWLDDSFKGLNEASLSDTIGCYAFTADKFEIPGLRALLPQRAENSRDCDFCKEQSGWLEWPIPEGGRDNILCEKCNGLGWIPEVPWNLHKDEIARFTELNMGRSESRLLERARLAMEHQQFTAAINCARSLLRNNLDHEAALEILGEAHHAQGMLNRAVIQFSQLACCTGAGRWHERAADTYLQLTETRETLTSFELSYYQEAKAHYERASLAYLEEGDAPAAASMKAKALAVPSRFSGAQ